MRNLRWAGLMIALAAAAVVTGCGVEVYDSPGYPGHYHDRGRHEGRAGDVEGTVVRISHRDHVLILDTGDGGDRRGRDRRDEVALFYDDETTVEYQGRDYRPEDLERGDRIQASVDSRDDRRFAEEIHVVYDASEGHDRGNRGEGREDRNGREGMAPQPPAQPDREGSAGQEEPGMEELRGTIRSVDASGRSLQIEPAADESEGSDDDSADEPSGVLVVYFDARTTVQFQGRSYGPENLEEGDVVDIHLRPSRNGRMVADQILVVGEGGGSRRSSLIGAAQTPSTRQPRISRNPATTSDQNPRLAPLLGR